MESKDIRLKNLLEIAAKEKNDKVFCEKIEMNPSYFSQVKCGRKAIGGNLARKIESALNLPTGFLDNLRDHEEPLPNHMPEASVMATAYAIEALPGHIRESVARLVFEIATEQKSERQKQVQPFDITIDSTGEKTHGDTGEVQARRKQS